MQIVSSALQAELNKGKDEPRVLVDLLEFYSADAVPGVSGFDPANAIEKFASQTITWNGIAYRREVEVRGEVSRSMGEQTNSLSLTFSNIDRYVATWAQTTTIEGLMLVVRCVNPDVTDDSLVLFVGRCDKPGDVDKKSFQLTARQDFGNINVTLPTSQYVAEDPNGRLPGDPLYEGIRFIAQSGTFTTGGSAGKSGLLGALLGGVVGWLLTRKKKVAPTSTPWSSMDFTPYGQVVSECFGRMQVQAVPIMFADTGYWLNWLGVWCKGPIAGVTNITMKNFTSYGLYDVQTHTGEIGGTGTTIPNHGSPYGLTPQTGGNSTEDFRFPGSGLFSLLAFSGISILQSGINDEPVQIDEPPMIVGLVQGRKIDLPDNSGVYNRTDWSDNGVHITRFIFTSDRFINMNPAFMEDSVNYLTGIHCDEPLIDNTNSQTILIPTVEIPQAGVSFKLYQSTGIYKPDTVEYLLGDLGQPAAPDPTDGPYTPVPSPYPTQFSTQPILRKRYTTNFLISEEVRAVDLLYKTVFPSFKGYLRVNKRGKYEIRTEKASDATRIRSSTAVAATSIPVFDVTPWKSGPDLLTGRLYVGAGLTTSEVRDLVSADYSTSGNSITLTAGATGTTTATASGATLSGGSTSVQASGTVTIGGTPAAGDIITATIDGIAVSYTLTSGDDTHTAAAMLSAYINATPRLRYYIRTVWASGSPTVITIKCLHGALNLSSTTGFPTLLLAHTGPIADPTTAPTASGSSGGTLAAGTWLLAYADVTAIGLTALTALRSVVVTANQKIDVSSLPALVGIARNFYLSDQAGSTNLRYVAQRTNASNFSITDAPLPGAALPPSYNTTAEEVIRIAASFATNSQDIYSSWKPSELVLLNDIRLPDPLNGHKYQATSVTTGITGTTQPTFPTTVGGTVVDGGVTWTEIGTTVLAQAGLTRANIVRDSFKWCFAYRRSRRLSQLYC